VADHYFSYSTGSDAYATPDIGTPWKTLAKLRAHTLVAGDNVYLMRGDTWPEVFVIEAGTGGTIISPITIDAYGTGAKPIISGSVVSVDLNNDASWTETSSHLWKTANSSLPVNVEVGNLVFDGIDSIGRSRESAATCVAQGEFWSDMTNDCLYLYSVGNPGTAYSDIKAAQYYWNTTGGPVVTKNYIHIRNLQFKWWGMHGLCLSGCTGSILELCDFRWIGGARYSPTTGWLQTNPRDGNGLMFYRNASGLIIRNNTFTDVWETGISYQIPDLDTSQVNGIYIYGNVISRSSMGFDIWPRSVLASLTNYYICHNIVYDTGGSLLNAQRTSQVFRGYRFYAFGSGNYCAVTNLHMENNVFHTTALRWQEMNSPGDFSGCTIDYNIYYPVSGDDCSYYGVAMTFAEFQTASGKDVNSLTVDPEFTTLGSDWHAADEFSPLVDGGTVINGFPWDVIGTAPDIGIYEHPLETIPPPLPPPTAKLCPFRRV
jgi:hypothetical protein